MEAYRLRTGVRLTYDIIAERTGISVATLQSLAARPGYNTRLSTVERLCRALECGPGDLLALHDSPEKARMKIDKDNAKAMLRAQAAAITDTSVDPAWRGKVERLSQLCEEGVSKTHIAFLGTVLLAKSLHRSADLYAIKPKLVEDNANAFSARTLCHSVLVPLAAELGINLGVTGREPLNNQPYFRMSRLGDETPIHGGGRAAFDYMVGLVKELQAAPTEDAGVQGLRAFIAVRRAYQPRYTVAEGGANLSPEQLTAAIAAFVREDSEGGKRAQAVVAGLMDVFAGDGRVESGRINDPSRKYPGDVCVRSADDPETFDKAIEVRDKPVQVSDIQIFGKKCIDMGVREAAVVMASERQPPLDRAGLATWAAGFGLGLTLFVGWETFVDQVLFWSELPKPEAAIQAALCVETRLLGVEASPASVQCWQTLVRRPAAS